MAKQLTCHTCVYAHWDSGLWLRSLGSAFPPRPSCGNQPDFPGRMKECPYGGVCRNYRARPPVPTGEHVKMIPLTNGFYAYVDAEDYEWLNQWHWRAYSMGYAGRYEKGKVLFMHRQIMRPPPGKVVDHINGNGFDNTRANMRNTTKQQNGYNQPKHIGSASIYKGVARDKRNGKWYANIQFRGTHRSSRLFEDEAEAARLYDQMAVGAFGKYARLNFPEEWSPQRRARVHAQWQKDRRKTRGKEKARSKKGPSDAAGKKPQTRGRRKTKAGR